MESSSSSTSITSVRFRNDAVELHELRLLRSIVREIYRDTGDAEDENTGDAEDEDSGESENEEAHDEPSEVHDVADGGLQPFIPMLNEYVNPSDGTPDFSEEESSDDEFSTPEARAVAIHNSFQSEAAQSVQASLVKELAEPINQPSGEQVTN